MKTTLFIAGLVALVATWAVERHSAAQLVLEITAQREQQRELANLQRERDRLRALQPSADELESLRRVPAEHTQLQHAIAEQTAAPATRPPGLPMGDWTPAGEWKNRGHATPHAAVETALWATAGGDVSTLKNLLILADPTREQAAALLTRIPESSRSLYATPEDLIASFTIKNVPVGEAQLVWFNQISDDDATACVFLRNQPMPGENIKTEAAPSSPQPPLTREEAAQAAAQRKAERAANPDRAPPSAPDNHRSSETYLSLHRDADGWRLVVPPSAVATIAKELDATR